MTETISTLSEPPHGHQMWHLTRLADQVIQNGHDEAPGSMLKRHVLPNGHIVSVLDHPEYGQHVYVKPEQSDREHLIRVIPVTDDGGQLHTQERIQQQLSQQDVQTMINGLRAGIKH